MNLDVKTLKVARAKGKRQNKRQETSVGVVVDRGLERG